MILDIYKDAFEYSAQDWTALVKLGIITVMGIFILPLFLAMGYSYRVVKTAINGMINGDDELPEFNEWVQMFLEGIKLFVVEFVYSLVPMILFVLVFFAAKSVGGTAGGLIIVLGIIIGIIVSIFFALMSVIAIAEMAENEDKLSAAFNINGIIDALKSIGYLNAAGTWIGMEIIIAVLYVLVFAILHFIVLFLGFSTTLVGANIFGGVISVGTFVIVLILNLLVSPYLCLFQYRVYGLLYNLQ